MAELWRDLVELLRSRPALWLPVLIADLLSYGINLGRNSLVRVIVLHNTAQQSVLGGTVVHGPMTASAMESTTIVALLLSWLTNFARILLYTCAFVATAALIQAFRERASKPAAAVLPALGRFWGGILDIALRALALYSLYGQPRPYRSPAQSVVQLRRGAAGPSAPFRTAFARGAQGSLRSCSGPAADALSPAPQLCPGHRSRAARDVCRRERP